MKHKILFYTLLFYVSFSFSQERFESKTFGFSIDIPEGWGIDNGDDETIVPPDTILSEAEKDDLFKDGYLVYLVNSIKPHNRIYPHMTFSMVLNIIDDFEIFKKEVTSGLKKVDYYNNLKILVEPTEIIINNNKYLYLIMTYTKENSDQVIRNTVYLTRYKKYVYQLEFLDIPSEDDYSKLYSELIKTVKIE